MTQEQMSDPLDRAAAEEDATNQEALRRARLKSAGMPQAQPDGLCVDCGEPVEPGRLSVNLGRCLSCQQDNEDAMARYHGRRR
jgi:RNA polymerase-binding transcription factor DksA